LRSALTPHTRIHSRAFSLRSVARLLAHVRCYAFTFTFIHARYAVHTFRFTNGSPHVIAFVPLPLLVAFTFADFHALLSWFTHGPRVRCVWRLRSRSTRSFCLHSSLTTGFRLPHTVRSLPLMVYVLHVYVHGLHIVFSSVWFTFSFHLGSFHSFRFHVHGCTFDFTFFLFFLTFIWFTTLRSPFSYTLSRLSFRTFTWRSYGLLTLAKLARCCLHAVRLRLPTRGSFALMQALFAASRSPAALRSLSLYVPLTPCTSFWFPLAFSRSLGYGYSACTHPRTFVRSLLRISCCVRLHRRSVLVPLGCLAHSWFGSGWLRGSLPHWLHVRTFTTGFIYGFTPGCRAVHLRTVHRLGLPAADGSPFTFTTLTIFWFSRVHLARLPFTFSLRSWITFAVRWLVPPPLVALHVYAFSRAGFTHYWFPHTIQFFTLAFTFFAPRLHTVALCVWFAHGLFTTPHSLRLVHCSCAMVCALPLSPHRGSLPDPTSVGFGRALIRRAFSVAPTPTVCLNTHTRVPRFVAFVCLPSLPG